MESIQSSGIDEEPIPSNSENSEVDGSSALIFSEFHEKPPPLILLKKKRKKIEPAFHFSKESPYDKYSKELNTDSTSGFLRSKRAIGRMKEKEKNTCSLFIQTDPLIWRHISEQVMCPPILFQL